MKIEGNIIQNRDSVIKKGIDAYFKKDTFILKESTNHLLNIFNKHNDSIALAKYYHYKALKHKINYKQDSSYYYYTLSKNISLVLKDSLETGRRLLSMGNLQRNVKDYIGSELSLNESINFLEPIKAYKYLTSVYNGLGLVHLYFNDFEKSREDYKKSLEMNQHIKDEERKKSSYLYNYNNIGLSYQLENNQKKAIVYFNRGLKFYDSIKEKYPNHYGLLLENLACSNFLLGNTKDALLKYHEAVDINKSISNFHNLATNYINISNYHSFFKNHSKAKNYSKLALKYAKKSHNNRHWLIALENLGDLTQGEESKKYLQQYIKLNDRLIEKERKITNNFAKIKFENDKREKENTLLKLENEKKKNELNQQKQQNLVIGIFAATCLFALIIGFLIFSFRRKKILLNGELKRIKTKEEERTRISKELHDGILGKLFGIRLGLGFIDIKTNNEENNNYKDFLDQLQDVEKEIREVSHKLTIDTEHKHFPDLITELVKSKSTIGSFNYKIDIISTIDWETISNELKTNLHRIIHEVLNNIIKHAKASEVILKINKNPDIIILNIKDNGIGFDKASVIDGIGIKNITSRINNLKGNLTINTLKGKGTNIIIKIPI